MVRWSADDIIYEDEQILVCRKHSGMAVQSARVGQMDLESELRNYRNGNYIGIVQRLDQPVEGVLVFGKTPQATAWLNKQHQNGMMKKEYLAVFTGTPVKEKQGIWEDYLIKDGKTNTSRVTGKKDRMAKKAVLSYRIMDWRDDRGLAEIRLGTGRHHQIRVQMAHHGQDGVDYSVYSAIAPKACLWSTARWLWTNNAGGGYGTGPFKTFGVRCFMEDLGVKHHFVQKDGVWEIPLPYAFE